MCGKYSLTKFANFLIIVLRAEIVTKLITKFANFAWLYFRILQHFANKFGILVLLKGSFREFEQTAPVV